MPLKIIHHRENNNIKKEDNKKHFDYNVEETLRKMYSLCDKIINFSHFILEKIDFEQSLKNNNMQNLENKFEEIKQYIAIFELIFGKKMSIVEAISKATSLIQKIQIIAEKFGVSLIEEEQNHSNEEYLTDDDIDMMVQMVKDFGEDKLRKDARNCKRELEMEQKLQQKEFEDIDVYDIYHDNE